MNKKQAKHFGFWFCLLAAATALSWLAEKSANVRVPQKDPRAEPIKQTLERIKLPPGFKVSLYALLPSARHLAVGPNGQVIFVGTTDTKVYSVTVDAASGVAKDVSEFALSIPKKLPSGVCFAKDGTLYVAEINQVLAFPRAEGEYQNPSITAKVIVAQDKPIPAEDEG